MQIDPHASADCRTTVALVSKTTGEPLSLTFESAGLIIAIRPDNSASVSSYPQSTGKIETITTIGTFEAPTATKCRFKETGIAGEHEIHFVDTLWSTAGAKRLYGAVYGASDLKWTPFSIELSPKVDVDKWKGQTAATVDTNGYPVVTIKDGTGQGELLTTSGLVDADVKKVNGTAQTAGDIVALINALPAALGIPTYYYPTTATRVVGDNDGGVVGDLASEDGAYYSTGEVNTGTFLEVVLELATGDTTNHPTDLYIPGWYVGAGSHRIDVFRWDFNGGVGDWETDRAFAMYPRSDSLGYRCALYPRNVSAAGLVKLKFLHAGSTSGQSSHVLNLDMAQAAFRETSEETATALAQIYSLLQDVDDEVDNIETIVETNLDGKVSDVPTASDNATATAAAMMVTPANKLATDASGAVKADVISISSDSTAADNLELQFDGTGLTGNTFPATQLQINNLPGVIWNTLTSTLTTVGSIGKHLVDIALNAAGVRNNIIIVKSRQDNDYKEPGSYRFKGGRDFKNK